MKFMSLVSFLLMGMFLASCSSFKAERVDADKSDEKAMEITDKWVARDTETVVKDIMNQLSSHRGLRNYMSSLGHPPRLFIGEIQNMTSEAYFPINDINDEFLDGLSASGDFVLVDAAAREALLKEITYQNDGMVDPKTAKSIGKQTGADLMIFGNVYMKPEERGGKTIKEYRLNVRMTNVEKAVEVFRGRTRLNKYSEQSKSGW